ncbi:camp-regulated phosphoprotein/endosulfine conserved region-domain-containing protein [Entophlyctis helioformis]|nr:camp-regulated phosphoprotein/endosulfine conserved region-domain-containing protein [Entophlyctis helioformis]
MEVDLSKLSEEDKAFYQKYGRLPPPKKAVLNQRLKGGDRKYFDSGDYALSKAGKSSPSEVGSQHPSPERIPHSIPQNLKKNDVTNSPVKESSLTHESSTTDAKTATADETVAAK